MSPLWLLPGLILLVGGAAIIALLRSAAEEARQLATELGRQRDVGDAARRLGVQMAALRSPLRSHR
jgi:cytochrome c-type biogenesis protein CcmH/NrfF